MATLDIELFNFIKPLIDTYPDAVTRLDELESFFKDKDFTKEDLTTLAYEVYDVYLDQKKENKEEMRYVKRTEIMLKFNAILGNTEEQNTMLKLLPETYKELQVERKLLKFINKDFNYNKTYNDYMHSLLLLLWVEILQNNRDLKFERAMVFKEHNKSNRKYFGDSEIDNVSHYEKVIKMLSKKKTK
jgi:hypothetical protein